MKLGHRDWGADLKTAGCVVLLSWTRPCWVAGIDHGPNPGLDRRVNMVRTADWTELD